MPYTVKQLSEQLAADPALAQKVAANPAEEIGRLVSGPPIRPATYTIVVIFLGVALLGTLVAAGIREEVSEFIVAIGSGALGALAGLLAPSPTQT